MTAIAGVWHWGASLEAASACASMLEAQQMYGPHHRAQLHIGDLALGRCLYRLLPEDSHDTGPVCSQDGRFTLVADVRLDNRDALISVLALPATQAARMCDTAVLLAAFERWDSACLEHVVGDFAFALWDRQLQRLLLARDFLGQRPLHYHRGDGWFAFASMPRGLHALPGVARVPDASHVAEFLLGLPEYDSASFFAGIERVEGGQLLTITAAGIHAERYWNPARRHVRYSSSAACAAELRAHLQTATAARLRRSEGGVGAHLSAGYDSSAVAATAAGLLDPAAGLTAFTYVPRANYDGPAMPGRLLDEGALAASTAARHPAIEHVLIRTGARSPLDELDETMAAFERPYVNLCNLAWSSAINAAARERGIRVLLTGQLGNFGLSMDGRPMLADILGRGRMLTWWRVVRGLVANGHLRWRGALALSFGAFLPLWMWRSLKWLAGKQDSEARAVSAIHPQCFKQLDVPARVAACDMDLHGQPSRDSHALRLWGLRRVDLGNSNKGMLARWGVDVRDPTADRRLIEFCLSLAPEQVLCDGQARGLGRRALAELLPEEVLNERRKGLQAVDWHESMSARPQQLHDELALLAADPLAAATVDIERLQAIAGRWGRAGPPEPHRIRPLLLRGISAAHFLVHAGRGKAQKNPAT